ncbi:MAG: hypothetical protein IPN20_23685 [Haliscomenobacter sp.]|nr:hypothetical protein [Haliscomenobacter sp.]
MSGHFPACLGIISCFGPVRFFRTGPRFSCQTKKFRRRLASGQEPLVLDKEVLDTFPIYFLYAGNPEQAVAFSDSLLDDFFHQYDPVRKRVWDYKNLGVPGSAHQALVYEPRMRRGLIPVFINTTCTCSRRNRFLFTGFSGRTPTWGLTGAPSRTIATLLSSLAGISPMD